MGNIESESIEHGIMVHLKEEYYRVRKDKTREYLVVSEVLAMKPSELYKINLNHFGTLWVLDSDHDGRFTFEQIVDFATFYKKNSKSFSPHELCHHIHAMTTLMLYKDLLQEGGEVSLVAWVGKILYEDDGVSFFEQLPEVAYVKLSSVKVLYDILNVKILSGMSIQKLFDLLQSAGEELGLMILQCEELDEYVPLVVCQEFAREFLKGFKKLAVEVGLSV